MFNTEEAIQQLKKDKNTILEGYVCEFLFENQFLKPRNADYSSGWWISSSKQNYYAFFFGDETRSAIEIKIAETLSTAMDVWFVRFSDRKFEFRNSKEESYIGVEDFIKRNNLTPKNRALMASTDQRSKERQTACIDFFKNNGLLIKIAEQRCFADDLLSVYFDNLVNVDYFTIKDNTINLIEIKFKYSTRNNAFGFDKGLGKTFDWLADSCKIKLFHYILLKPLRDESFTIFDYIKRTDIERFWIYTELHNISQTNEKYAPKKTSVDGRKDQKYYPIAINKFKLFDCLRLPD